MKTTDNLLSYRDMWIFKIREIYPNSPREGRKFVQIHIFGVHQITKSNLSTGEVLHSRVLHLILHSDQFFPCEFRSCRNITCPAVSRISNMHALSSTTTWE